MCTRTLDVHLSWLTNPSNTMPGMAGVNGRVSTELTQSHSVSTVTTLDVVSAEDVQRW